MCVKINPRVQVFARLCPTQLDTLFSREGFLCLPIPFLAMYDVPKLVLATVFWPDGATCVIS